MRLVEADDMIPRIGKFSSRASRLSTLDLFVSKERCLSPVSKLIIAVCRYRHIVQVFKECIYFNAMRIPSGILCPLPLGIRQMRMDPLVGRILQLFPLQDHFNYDRSFLLCPRLAQVKADV
jgi:hypothetical protein